MHTPSAGCVPCWGWEGRAQLSAMNFPAWLDMLPCHCRQGEGEGAQPQFQPVLFSSATSLPSHQVAPVPPAQSGSPPMPKHAIPLS